MTSDRIRKIIIIGVTLLGIIINSVYGIDLLIKFFDSQISNTLRDVLISAIALEIGWAALLIWAIFKPLERRHVLLFTAIPMMLGNLLHSNNQSMYIDNSAGAIALNLVIGFVFAGVFVFAFFVGKPKKSEK